MTTRLYYDDSYLRTFTASVVGLDTLEGKPAVVLDRTAFYPTSGGQPYDTGRLGNAGVLAVEESDTGTILHMVDAPIAPGEVEGSIDWERRFDHMQQHTGQHILSQAFVQAARAATLSFHLGPETSTIDIDMAQPAPESIQQAEELATRIVFEDRPVNVVTVDRAQLSSMGVRKESQRVGEIRVIDVEGFDRSPCGGTHVRRTGEIGIIAVLGWERYKGGTRVEFVCGYRAFRALRKDHSTLKQLSRLFSAHPDEIPQLAEKLFQERAALARENARSAAQLLELEAGDLARNAPRAGEYALVRQSFESRPFESLKLLAQKIAALGRAVAILATRDGKAQIAVARSPDVPADVGALVKELCARRGGKGGGRPELAQAGGIDPEHIDSWAGELEEMVRAGFGA
jgi:alanyl-tRNA synthetase